MKKSSKSFCPKVPYKPLKCHFEETKYRHCFNKESPSSSDSESTSSNSDKTSCCDSISEEKPNRKSVGKKTKIKKNP